MRLRVEVLSGSGWRFGFGVWGLYFELLVPKGLGLQGSSFAYKCRTLPLASRSTRRPQTELCDKFMLLFCRSGGVIRVRLNHHQTTAPCETRENSPMKHCKNPSNKGR